jgi:hypothetical protein
LSMLLVDLQGADAGRVINGCILETARLLTILPLEVEEFDVNLDMMAWDLLLIPLVNG